MRACLLAPALVVCSFGLAPMTAVAAPSCGHANLHNPGHHYGLYKNGCIPAPRPPVKPPGPGHHPRPGSPPIGRSTAVKLTQSAVGGLAAFQPFFTVPGGVEQGTQGPDRNLWVIEALLPALLVIWLMLLAGARSFRMRPAEEPSS